MDSLLITEYLRSMEDMRKVFFYSKFQFDVPRGELSTLEAIYTLKNDNKKATTSSLSYLLMISKSAVSQAINTLERKGWVHRDIDEQDKRVYCFSLTDTGNEKINSIKEQTKNIVSYLLNQLGEDDLKELIRLHKKIYKIVELMIQEGRFNK